MKTPLIDDSTGVLHTTLSDSAERKAASGRWAFHLSLPPYLNRGVTRKFSVTIHGNEHISCFDARLVHLLVIRDGGYQDTLHAAAMHLDVKPRARRSAGRTLFGTASAVKGPHDVIVSVCKTAGAPTGSSVLCVACKPT